MKQLSLLLILCFSLVTFAQNDETTEYYRHLRYNHVSPFIPYSGIHPIDKATAKNTSHYVFKYDNSNRLAEIINNHYYTEKQHPLASTGVYILRIAYEDAGMIHTFYDINGSRMTNNRKVFKEVYDTRNKFVYKLSFYDLNDSPMQSNWDIAQYHWKQDGVLIIERRTNLEGEYVPLSPYFKFGTTGILLNRKGQPKAHYNLDENLKPINNEVGIASYHDEYDSNQNHTTYSYKDSNGKPVMTKSNFAVGKKKYDSIGNNIEIVRYDTLMKETSRFPIPSNTKTELAEESSQQDSLAIREKSLGYLIALQKVQPVLMAEVVNDSLNKITIGYDRSTKKEYARSITKSKLVETATNWNKANNKVVSNPFNQIKILDIYDRIATVKLVSDNWVEYLHLIKLDGNWTIINLLWQHKDINRYPKN